tara:strand:+ start:101 stop:541 length:441 start_codon:yes stop_codon:yes gene_type:complete
MSALFKVVVIIVLFAILGLNIFTYLAKGTDFLSSLTQKGGNAVLQGTQTAIDATVEGTKQVSDITKATVRKGTEILEKAVNQKKIEQKVNSDNDSSPIQQRGKGGYCYIGNWRGHRSCIHVDSDTYCLSGKIFPTIDVCVHPNLRV